MRRRRIEMAGGRKRLASFGKFKRDGLTLIEVVVGIALIGSLLTVMLIASGRLEKHRMESLKRLQAIETLNGLVTQFSLEGFPPECESRSIENQPSMAWSLKRKIEPTPQGTCVIRLSIRENSTHQGLNRGEGVNSQDLAWVELLVEESEFGAIRK